MTEQSGSTAVLEHEHLGHAQWAKMETVRPKSTIGAAFDRLFVAVGGLR